jgi:glyoxylase-like metal-dependent hydrolase (beta-lactamase superfamily II)
VSALREPTDVETIAPGLIRVPLTTPTLPPATRTNTFLLSTDAGLWVVDPGSPHKRELTRLLKAIDATPEGRAGVRAFIITHHHRDHWEGLDWLRSRLAAPLVARDHDRIHVRGFERASVQWFEEQATGYELIHTPGHASDHIVIRTSDGDILAGDLVAGIGTVVIDPPDGHMGDYIESLSRLLERGVRRLFPAHGPTIEDGPGKLEEYLAHRAMRENQVLNGLAAHQPATPADLVPDIYTDIPLLLYPFAARSVLSHLIKLEEEGKVQSSELGFVLEACRK